MLKIAYTPPDEKDKKEIWIELESDRLTHFETKSNNPRFKEKEQLLQIPPKKYY